MYIKWWAHVKRRGQAGQACYSRQVNFAALFPDFSLILIGYLVCRFYRHSNRPAGVEPGGVLGVLLVFSGAAVSLHHQKPVGP